MFRFRFVRLCKLVSPNSSASCCYVGHRMHSPQLYLDTANSALQWQSWQDTCIFHHCSVFHFFKVFHSRPEEQWRHVSPNFSSWSSRCVHQVDYSFPFTWLPPSCSPLSGRWKGSLPYAVDRPDVWGLHGLGTAWHVGVKSILFQCKYWYIFNIRFIYIYIYYTYLYIFIYYIHIFMYVQCACGMCVHACIYCRPLSRIQTFTTPGTACSRSARTRRSGESKEVRCHHVFDLLIVFSHSFSMSTCLYIYTRWCP